MTREKYIAVIDPAGRTPELDCFNKLTQMAPCPLHYHLPALFGLDSMHAEVPGIAGMILLGSSASVPDNLPWQGPMFDWIWARVEQQIPLLAICFGHQLVAHMLGGKVEFIDPVAKEKQKGIRQVSMTPPAFAPNLKSGPMVVSHCEIVTKVPECMTVFASSDSFRHDGLVHKTLPVWTLQPHPDATSQFMENQSIPMPEDPTIFDFGHELLRSFMIHCSATKTVAL